MKAQLLAAALILFASQALAFDKTDLDNLSFSGSCEKCDLSGINLIEKFDLSGGNFSGSNFINSEFKPIQGSPGTRCNDAGTSCLARIGHPSNPDIKTNFKSTNWKGSKFYGIEFANLNLQSSNMSKVFFGTSGFHYTDFQRADLSGSVWEVLYPQHYFTLCYECNFKKSNLSNMTVKGNPSKMLRSVVATCVPTANGFGGNFNEANLSNSKFYNLTMCNVSLAGVNLRNSTFNRVNLRGSNLMNADLTGSKFENVDLSKTYLRRANFTDSDISNNVKLTGADLVNVVFCRTKTSIGLKNDGCPK